jgi:extradiol dioxygenase family protein
MWEKPLNAKLPRHATHKDRFKEHTMLMPFHFAYHVRDLEQARFFYGEVLGCSEGRSTDTWVDFDFFGHQISLHLGEPFANAPTGKVGDHMVPMPHFGLVLDTERFLSLAKRLTDAGVDFVLPPSLRFKGQQGEQWTMFFRDPSGNPIEVKGFSDQSQIFAS